MGCENALIVQRVESSAKMSRTSMVIQSKDVLLYLLTNLGRNQVRSKHSSTEFDLVLQLDYLESLNLDALGLTGLTAIFMHVTLSSVKFYGGRYQPAVRFSTDVNQPTHGIKTQATHDKVLHQISKISEAFFAEHWPCHTKLDTLTFLRRLFRHVQARVLQLGNFCVVCGHRQEHAGLKPVPCESKACNYAFDEHGTGADLRDIYTRPIIADLLISMASAACQRTSRRDSLFQRLPSDLLIATDLNKDGYPFASQINWQRMEEALLGIPSVASMAKLPDLQDLFPNISLQARSVKLQLLRSVLNSCQGHLMQLQDLERFPGMPTEYQFRLCSDRPSKEAVFAILRDKHGSQFLFHGSPFFNWHCIMREGLKNMTGSKLMLNGQDFGSGIYLAENSVITTC